MATDSDSTTSTAPSGFLSNILTPGSSTNPAFLVILDAAFALLLCVFLALLFLTRGNIHICVLILIEGCLWGSVKWFIAELRRTPIQGEVKAAETQKEKIE